MYPSSVLHGVRHFRHERGSGQGEHNGVVMRKSHRWTAERFKATKTGNSARGGGESFNSPWVTNHRKRRTFPRWKLTGEMKKTVS